MPSWSRAPQHSNRLSLLWSKHGKLISLLVPHRAWCTRSRRSWRRRGRAPPAWRPAPPLRRCRALPPVPSRACPPRTRWTRCAQISALRQLQAWDVFNGRHACILCAHEAHESGQPLRASHVPPPAPPAMHRARSRDARCMAPRLRLQPAASSKVSPCFFAWSQDDGRGLQGGSAATYGTADLDNSTSRDDIV